jgi:TonB-dependent SusC/RagA subfamily outer membrane receptor
LKDASASAIYGARAPFGVLIVTTKMGKRNEKTSITYSGNYGIVNPVRMPEVVDSYTFALSKNQAQLNGRQTPAFLPDHLDLIYDNIQNPGKYTDEQLNPAVNGKWGGGTAAYNHDFIDVWIKPSFRHQHDLSIRGGSEKSSYFVSGGFVHQPGNLNYVEDFDYYDRFNINGGIETDVNNWLKLTYRSRYSYELSMEPTTEYNAGRSRLYSFAYGAWPIQAITNPDGGYNNMARINTGVNGGARTNKQHRLDNILALDFSLAEGWSAHVDGTWRINF